MIILGIIQNLNVDKNQADLLTFMFYINQKI